MQKKEVKMSEFMLSMIEYLKDKIQNIFTDGIKYEISYPVIILWGNQSQQVTTVKLDCPQKYWHSTLINGLKDHEADGYILVCEAWMSQLGIDDPLNEKIFDGKMRVHELKPADRSDILLIIGSERRVKPIIWMANIDIGKEHRNLIGWQKIEDGSLHSALVVSCW
jgi:hypothetical protein